MIDNLLSKPQTKLSPDNRTQIDQLKSIASQHNVQVVTVTIGGNDLGFAAKLGDCFIRTCLAHIADDKKSVDKVVSRIQRDVIPALRKAAPNAAVILVGYPRLFPETGVTPVNCGWLTPGEQRNMNTIQEYFDARAAAAASTTGVSYVSVLNASHQHELCTADSWFYPINATTGGQLRGHPIETSTKHGQSSIAAMVAAGSGGRLHVTYVPNF